MSDAKKGTGMRSELRILIASLLSMVVIVVWAKFFAPKPPPKTANENPPAATGPATAGTPASGTSTKSTEQAKTPAMAPAPASATPAEGDSQERTTAVESDLYRVEFSNRGGVVKSWQLKKYMDDGKPPKVLDLVHPEASQYIGAWPFSVVLNDADLQKTANLGLYKVESAGKPAEGTIAAPGEIDFKWSDGHLEVTKKFRFDESYEVKAEISAKLDGKPITAGLAWLGGFGDLTVSNPGPVETVQVFYSVNEKLTTLHYKKLEDLNKLAPATWQGGKDWTGIEDTFFAAVFLPLNGATPGTLETRYWKDYHPIKVEGQEKAEPIQEIATTTSAQPVAMRVFVGPKDYDHLKKMTPPLHSLVNFGWLELIADPLFHGLKWLHEYIPNWGWAIVALTILINMVFFPLRIWTYKSTLKMQRVAPEVKAIQAKYKKYKMNDPRKAEMNKEVMAVYSREGINPVGSCIPQLLQLPIWYGLYRALQGTIELRHAPWFWWIHDLSAKDPYYILPVLMGLLMYFSTKITPMPSTGDPQQQAMMKIMPIGMAVFFVIIPYPSGLAVYIVAQYLVGIVQQYYLNKRHPLPPPGALKPKKATA